MATDTLKRFREQTLTLGGAERKRRQGELLEEMRADAVATSGRHPYFAKMMRDIPEAFTLDVDELFERGLASMLDGFAPLIERGRMR